MTKAHKARAGEPSAASTHQRAQSAWIVTAPYEVPACFGSDRSPWGDYHLRHDSALFTICGLPTASWISFWTIKPQPDDQNACPECRDRYFGDSQRQAETRSRRTVTEQFSAFVA